MNLRRLTVSLVIALLLSALCTWILSRRIGAASARHTPDWRYVAPASSLAAGETLKRENLELVEWPVSHPVPGAFAHPEDLIGRTLLYPLDQGQPITDKYVSTPGAGLGLAGRIPDGMRAVALRSDEVMGVGGFLLPGSHLDVLVTYRSEKVPEPVTLTVLQNAIVLAAGHQVQPDPEGKPTVATVVTLLLTPNDAERAVLASTQGTIHFILRSGSDQGKTDASPVLLSQLSGDLPKPSVIHLTPPSASPSSHPRSPEQHVVIETILGDKQTSETFPKTSQP